MENRAHASIYIYSWMWYFISRKVVTLIQVCLPPASHALLFTAAPLCSTQTIAEVKSIIRYHRTVIRIVTMMGVKMILSNERLKISRLVLSFSCWLRFICLIEIGANESYATRYNILLYRGNHLHLLFVDWDALYYTSQTFGFNSLHTTTTTFTNAWKYINITPMQMMMKEQDEGLEMLGQSAERLSKISLGIHEELGHQNKWVYRIWLRFEILENYGRLWSL